MWFFYTIASYLLCYGLTAKILTPLQAFIIPDATLFASLMYLPHGVRVLSVWLLGWKALPALFLAGVLSALLFQGINPNISLLTLLLGVLVGSCSGFAAFEICRLSGFNLYLSNSPKLTWKALIGIGALASIINSIGQIFVHSALISPSDLTINLFVYGAGDLAGLIASMFVLMYVFRFLR